jgi:hypothetical protein
VLEALGMKRAFHKEEAELDCMVLGGTWVDEVLHSVVIEVALWQLQPLPSRQPRAPHVQ